MTASTGNGDGSRTTTIRSKGPGQDPSTGSGQDPSTGSGQASIGTGTLAPFVVAPPRAARCVYVIRRSARVFYNCAAAAAVGASVVADAVGGGFVLDVLAGPHRSAFGSQEEAVAGASD